MLMFAIISMNLALLFYSIGVWSEKKQGTLKPWHIVVFFCGLIFDTLGTKTMGKIAGGSFKANFHGLTGLLALLLMLFHALWATWVYKKGTEKSKQDFHKFSIVVWAIWLIPFASGAIFGMAK